MTLSDLIARLKINPQLPDNIAMVVPARLRGETYKQLARRSFLITNIPAMKAREAAR